MWASELSETIIKMKLDIFLSYFPVAMVRLHDQGNL